jgi:hypothetical protein
MMNALELKIPPPVVVLGVAGLMGVIARAIPSLAAPLAARAAAAALAVVGLGLRAGPVSRTVWGLSKF